MTTIAANLEMMVADSKVTCGGGISYPTSKILRVKDAVVGAAGHSGDCSRFIDWAKSGFKSAKPKFECKADDEDSFVGLVLKKDGLYLYCQSYPEPERINAPFYAIGSGGKAARALMLTGVEPLKAVEIVCEVDDYSGPPIESIRISEVK